MLREIFKFSLIFSLIISLALINLTNCQEPLNETIKDMINQYQKFIQQRNNENKDFFGKVIKELLKDSFQQISSQVNKSEDYADVISVIIAKMHDLNNTEEFDKAKQKIREKLDNDPKFKEAIQNLQENPDALEFLVQSAITDLFSNHSNSNNITNELEQLEELPYGKINFNAILNQLKDFYAHQNSNQSIQWDQLNQIHKPEFEKGVHIYQMVDEAFKNFGNKNFEKNLNFSMQDLEKAKQGWDFYQKSIFANNKDFLNSTTMVDLLNNITFQKENLENFINNTELFDKFANQMFNTTIANAVGEIDVKQIGKSQSGGSSGFKTVMCILIIFVVIVGGLLMYRRYKKRQDLSSFNRQVDDNQYVSKYLPDSKSSV